MSQPTQTIAYNDILSFIRSNNRIEKHRRLIEEAHMKAIEQALRIIESHEAIINRAMKAIESIRQNIPIIVDTIQYSTK